MTRTYRSSRLARKESQRLIKQSLMLMVLSIVILVGILVWGIPALVRYAGFLGEVKNTSTEVNVETGITPFPPQLEISYSATSSANIDIKGYSEPGSNVTLFNNNVEVGRVVSDEEGEFLFRAIRLTKGDNMLSATTTNSAGQTSGRSVPNSVWFDNQPPTLELEDLTDGSTVSDLKDDLLIIGGRVKAESNLYVNNRLVAVDEEGDFEYELRLSEGENVIEFRVVDLAGNELEREYKIKYER